MFLGGQYIVGHSYGGSIALKIAADYPSEVDSVVLIGTPAFDHKKPGFTYTLSTLPLIGTIFNCCIARFFAPSEMKKAINGMFYGTIPPGFVEFRTKLWSRPRQLKSHAQEFLSLGEDLRSLTPGLKAITAKTLIIAGEADQKKTLDDAKELHKIISGSKLIIVPKSGHYVHVEQPDTVINSIKRFMNRD